MTYNDVEDLKAAVTEESVRLSCYQLAATRRNFYDRLGFCLSANADVFEYLI